MLLDQQGIAKTNALKKPAGRGPFAIELLEPKSTDSVLNIGCFDGALEYYFLRGKVKHFQGIDLNESAVTIAKRWASELGLPTNTFQVSAGESLPFGDASFDKVLCLDVFEHVADEQRVADEIFRVLKPGGTLVLSVPHDFLNFLDPDELTRDLRNFVRTYIRKKPLLDHPKHRHYSEDALKNFFKKFQMTRVHKCGTPVFWGLAMAYTAFGLPQSVVRTLSHLTDWMENLDYKVALPTGFNIMIQVKKPR
jgi:2-polyprenyl-3-methyl-5-hydroxy-6-metoxy-1,4-benzoquinol methylase